MAEQQATPQTFLGMPMNWDWDPQRILRNMWNPDDDRIFLPKVFGIGWDINGYAVLKTFGLAPDNGDLPSVDDIKSKAQEAASNIRKEI